MLLTLLMFGYMWHFHVTSSKNHLLTGMICRYKSVGENRYNIFLREITAK